MSLGTLTLNRLNGREVYPVTVADMYLYPANDSVEICIVFKAGQATEKTSDDELEVMPEGEISFNVAKFEPEQLVGKSFEVPEGAVDGEWLARLYYFEHQPIDHNVIEILAYKKWVFDIHWVGKTCDVNFYDGSKPKTEFEVRANFALKEKFRS